MNEDTKERENEKMQANVQFRSGGTTIAVAGIIGGAGIALGLPLIVLCFGQSLGSTLLTIFVLTGLLVGGVVALAAAVLGLVIPQQVNGAGPGNWGRHAFKHWAMRHWCDQPVGDWRNWSEQEWKDWADKKKEE
jgi:hypothetical protein